MTELSDVDWPVDREPLDALLEACEVAGGQSALARLLELKSQGTISGWIALGRAPAERVLAIEAKTGVSRHRLRRDLYPVEISLLTTKRKRA